MIGLNAGFGAPLPDGDLQQMADLRYQVVRAEINPSQSDEQVDAILRQFVGSPVKLLVLLCGGALIGTEGRLLPMHAVRVWMQAHALGVPLAGVCVGNEPDLAGLSPAGYRGLVLATHRALRSVGYAGAIYAGEVSNLHRKGLDYLDAMQWATLPADVSPSVHRYAPKNDPAKSHSTSRKAEWDAAVHACAGRIPAVTETGYHTAPEYFLWFVIRRLSDTQAAAAIKRDVADFRAWGAPLVTVYQWNDGPSGQYYDRFGLRDAAGALKPQAYALSALCPAPPAVNYCRVSVFAAESGLAPVTGGTLTFDDPTWPVLAAELEDGRLKFTLPAAAVYGWGVNLTAKTPEHASTWRVTLAPDIDVAMPPVFQPLPRLIPRGHVFRQEPDTRFYGIMASGFAAYERYLKEGKNAVIPVLEQRQALGFNMQRVWTAYAVPGIGNLWPFEHQGFYERLPEFCDLLARYGQYAYITSLTGTWPAGFDLIEHVARVEAAIVGCTNALSDRRNEADHPANTQARGLTLRPAPDGLLWSEGSGQMDVHPPTPLGPYYAFHPDSRNEWTRKVGKQGWEVDPKKPCLTDETIRLEDGNKPLWQIEEAAACGQMFGAGACFHSPAGKLFTLYSGYELDAAQAWVTGSTRFELEVVQDGQYVNLPPGGLLRIYEKRWGDRVARLEMHTL